MKTLLFTAAAFVAGLAAPHIVPTVAANRQPAQTPRVFMSSGGTALRVLVDAKSLGGNEVEVGELTFPANSDSGDHRHAVTETFFVLEGQLEQVVNGKPVALGPGGIVSIRSTDQVRHKSGPNGAKVLVIWAKRLSSNSSRSSCSMSRPCSSSTPGRAPAKFRCSISLSPPTKRLLWTNSSNITVSDRVSKQGPLFAAAGSTKPFSGLAIK